MLIASCNVNIFRHNELTWVVYRQSGMKQGRYTVYSCCYLKSTYHITLDSLLFLSSKSYTSQTYSKDTDFTEINTIREHQKIEKAV